MNNMTLKKENLIGTKIAVIILSALALAIEMVRYLYVLPHSYGMLIFDLPVLFDFLFPILSLVCAFVLTHPKAKKALLATLYGLIITEIVYYPICYLLFARYAGSLITFLLTGLPILILGIITFSRIFKGKSIKVFSIFILILTILDFIIAFIFNISMYSFRFIANSLILSFFPFLSLIFSSIALLLLSSSNTTAQHPTTANTITPNYINYPPQKHHTSPEPSLLVLIDKFELGLISEEEYMIQREKIINRRGSSNYN